MSLRVASGKYTLKKGLRKCIAICATNVSVELHDTITARNASLIQRVSNTAENCPRDVTLLPQTSNETHTIQIGISVNIRAKITAKFQISERI